MRLLILGANSDVAHAVAQKWACAEKADLVLASRDLAALDLKARDLRARGSGFVEIAHFDALDYDGHAVFYHNLSPKPDGVVLAFGYNGLQHKAQEDFSEAARIIDTNFKSAVSILEIVAADFQSRRTGFIIAIGSVAGLRGRQSNYVYGAAKGALAIYLDGLRNRLCKHNVRVMTVLPGFIDTKMTAGMNLPGLLTATPAQVAGDIYAAHLNAKDRIYTRWFWRWIMVVIRAIPAPLFNRLSL
jgi:decaprenylphospho-beta-D-erythro-pentofuranosid-2-ulose 2-reductase